MTNSTRRPRKKIRYPAAAGIAAGAGVAALAGAPAVAQASTGTVAYGGHDTAHDHSTNVFTDVTTGQSLTCPPWRAPGSGGSASGAGTSIETVSAVSCTTRGGAIFTVRVIGPWDFNPVSSSGGVVRGSITGFHLEAASTALGGMCTFSATGTEFATYTRSRGVVSVTSADLTVHGGGLLCGGLVNSGDSATYEGSLPVSFEPGAGPSSVRHRTS